MGLFIGVLFALVGGSSPKPLPFRRLGLQRCALALGQAAVPPNPALVSFAPDLAGALDNFPRCALFVCMLLFVHFPALRFDEAPHHTAVLEDPPAWATPQAWAR